MRKRYESPDNSKPTSSPVRGRAHRTGRLCGSYLAHPDGLRGRPCECHLIPGAAAGFFRQPRFRRERQHAVFVSYARRRRGLPLVERRQRLRIDGRHGRPPDRWTLFRKPWRHGSRLRRDSRLGVCGQQRGLFAGHRRRRDARSAQAARCRPVRAQLAVARRARLDRVPLVHRRHGDRRVRPYRRDDRGNECPFVRGGRSRRVPNDPFDHESDRGQHHRASGRERHARPYVGHSRRLVALGDRGVRDVRGRRERARGNRRRRDALERGVHAVR